MSDPLAVAYAAPGERPPPGARKPLAIVIFCASLGALRLLTFVTGLGLHHRPDELVKRLTTGVLWIAAAEALRNARRSGRWLCLAAATITLAQNAYVLIVAPGFHWFPADVAVFLGFNLPPIAIVAYAFLSERSRAALRR